MNWIKDVFAGLMTPVTKAVEGYQARKTLTVQQEGEALARTHELNIKKLDAALELAKQGKQIEANWDTEAQNQMKTSWKDEWFVFLFSIPLIASFIPEYQDDILKGFETLEKTPEWYIMLVMGIVAATFGLRWLISRGK